VPITYDSVVPWGRNFDEYCAMFALSDDDLAGRTLGCGDGPAAFNADLTARGGRVVSVDPIYQFTADEIRARIHATAPQVMEQTRAHLDDFVWTTIPSPEALFDIRMVAMNRFLADFPRGKEEGRYLAHALPDLPFPEGAFDLALSSHFLFLYSDHLSEDFHCRAVTEMLRVAREVRIFPLLSLARQPSTHIDAVRREAERLGRTWTIREVEYEFQRGGNEMLRIAARETCA